MKGRQEEPVPLLPPRFTRVSVLCGAWSHRSCFDASRRWEPLNMMGSSRSMLPSVSINTRRTDMYLSMYLAELEGQRGDTDVRER